METRTGADPARAGHDVLLAVAGRLPDRTLWRLREWSDAGPDAAAVALRTALPRTLLRHRVAVTEDERTLLRRAVAGWEGPVRLVDAVLHTDEAPPPSTPFAAEGPQPGWDTTDLVLRAAVPGGVVELLRTWRQAPGGRAGSARVVLVRAVQEHGPALASLTAAVQRVLRAHGEAEPRVEVLAPTSPVTPYHVAALAAAESLWPGDGPAPPASAEHRPTGELVGHG